MNKDRLLKLLHDNSESNRQRSDVKDIDLISMLLDEENKREEIKIEVYLNKDRWSYEINCEFRIGYKSMGSLELYVIKDINQFVISYNEKIPVQYGKGFIFSGSNCRISSKDRQLIDFIRVVFELDNMNKSGKIGEYYIGGKKMIIPKHMARKFFEIIKNHKIYLNDGFFSHSVEAEVILGQPNIEFDLNYYENNYILEPKYGMPLCYGTSNSVMVYGFDIYLPEAEFCYALEPYTRTFHQTKKIVISDEEEQNVLRKLIPSLRRLTPILKLSQSIIDKIVMEDVNFKFYFDKSKDEITLTVKVKYGDYEFNIFSQFDAKVVYRDENKEQKILNFIKNLGFETDDNKFFLDKDENFIFEFFRFELDKFHQLGEVFYSENFKGLKRISSKGIIGTIRAGKYNYFEMDFKIEDIPSFESTNILRAFRDNLKYYKLKTGEYIDLEQLELKQLLKLIDTVIPNDIKNNHIEVPDNKAPYFSEFLQKSELRYLKGKEALKKINDKLKNIKKSKFDIPIELTHILRDYQRLGFNWMKTIDNLGFGGILADEMGLGKTITAISLVASAKEAKTLIVVPTSLVYNWTSEFEKFAPSIKVIAVYANKSDRDIMIRDISQYDVIITTYNLLKRDIESYKKQKFDYCILDEAQYIKNAHSQNAIAAKEIIARTKFALTGTPVENSLMELWSIFDFIMPGYLYDEKRFSVRYYKKLNEEPEIIDEINKLIKPFILRRNKKNVIKELPDKIERNFYVSLGNEQKKIYQTYATYVTELIEKKVQQEEFEKSKIEILAYITKLRQICLDPSVVIENYYGESEKIEALVEILKEATEEKHKILVFSQFTSVLRNIQRRLEIEQIDCYYLDGSVPSKKRVDLVKDFNGGATQVFLLSLKAGGTGLNLTGADVVIHFDPWWNPAVENQATDRVHRIGQKNVVEVIKIIAKGTIEEKVISLQNEKKELIEKLLGDETDFTNGLGKMSADELMDLFTVHN